MKTKSIYLSLAFMFICLGTVSNVEAVPRPDAINWRSSPTGFVTSLYVGVLGRRPENRAVVNAWARRVNSSPTSRWNAFWAFTRSSEYRNSRWARQRRQYRVYSRINRNDTISYTVSKGPLGAEWRVVRNRETFGIAAAIRNYYQAFRNRR